MYGRAFESTFTGSMVGSGATTFAVWFYVICHAKPPDGEVELNATLIAAAIGCDVAEVRTVIEALCSPDPDSRSEEEDGRRLLRTGQFDYQVVNWEKYQAMRSQADRREQNREAKRRQRASTADVSASVSTLSADVSTSQQKSAALHSTCTVSTSGVGEPERKRGAPKTADKPEDVSEEVWSEWLAFRRTKRAPVTDLVLSSTRKKAIDAGMTMDEALTHWLSQGQVGFYPPGKGGVGGTAKKTGGDHWRELNDTSKWPEASKTPMLWDNEIEEQKA